MKKFNRTVLSLCLIGLFSIAFHSCKKINEATELGGDLIPTVDNVNTFETILETETNNRFNFTDDTRIFYGDDMVLGSIMADLEFGKTNASIYANLNPPSFTYPFYNKDSVLGIDSVILSLGYRGSFGDTSLTATPTTIRVFEVSQNADFSDSSTYLTTRDEFPVSGQLGQGSFTPGKFKDSISLIRKSDTTKVANVLRIRLSNAFGERLKNLDTVTYKTYSAFYDAVKGIAIKPDAIGNTLSYFALSDLTKSRVIVYYRVTRNGLSDTTSTNFTFGPSNTPGHGTVANVIKRTPEAAYASYLSNNSFTDDKLYIQSAPGSLGTIKIPGLDTLSNYIIHRAELIVTKLPSLSDGIFQAPPVLYLEKGSFLDSAMQITDDLVSAATISASTTQIVTVPNFSAFGGALRGDNTYRFTLTRHIQEIATYKQPNYYLRLFAPLRTTYRRFGSIDRIVNVLPQVAYGRVVVAGGDFADVSKRLRLRIIYSRVR